MVSGSLWWSGQTGEISKALAKRFKVYIKRDWHRIKLTRLKLLSISYRLNRFLAEVEHVWSWVGDGCQVAKMNSGSMSALNSAPGDEGVWNPPRLLGPPPRPGRSMQVGSTIGVGNLARCVI